MAAERSITDEEERATARISYEKEYAIATAIAAHTPAPRAPEVTVTRDWDSLCQKECYPMAFIIVNCF